MIYLCATDSPFLSDQSALPIVQVPLCSGQPFSLNKSLCVQVSSPHCPSSSVFRSANTDPTRGKMAESQRRPSTGRRRLSSTPRLSITGGRRWSVVETLQPDLLHNIRYVLFSLSYYSAFLVPNTLGKYCCTLQVACLLARGQ